MADLPASHGPDLHDVLAGRATPLEAVREGPPVSILPCGRTLDGARSVVLPRLHDAVTAVADAYGRVVVDSPAGVSGDVGMALCVAEACVMVTTPDSAALADAIRARALARELDAGLVQVVLNHADGAGEAESLAREFGAPVTAVPTDPAVSRAQASGQPVFTTAPDSRAADRLRAVASRVQSVRSSW
jgi:septum site-determining protein MinD